MAQAWDVRAIARFSRWCRRVVRVPCSADDPRGYLTAIAAALRQGRYDALLPTHEQAWLFAAGRHLSLIHISEPTRPY